MIQLPSDFYIDEKTNYFGFLPLINRFGWNNTPLHFGVKIYEWDEINGHNFVCGKKIIGWYFESWEVYNKEVENELIGREKINKLVIAKWSLNREIQQKSENIVLQKCRKNINNILNDIIDCYKQGSADRLEKT